MTASFPSSTLEREQMTQDGSKFDKGPWSVGQTQDECRVYIQSDDFTHDVRLYVDGDFGSSEEKKIYAEQIASRLNTPPASAQPERDWELTCDHCNGDGFVYVERQVAERKSDVQEFKEDCECCEGRGFTIAFEDIPGIAEYVRKSRPVASAQDDAKDAARWRAFVGCARIRPLGSAGLEQPEPNHYAHMGLEIWTRYGRDYSAPLLKEMDDQNERARRWLVMFADVAIAASQQQEG